MNITPKVVRELLDYSPETGVFTWRDRGACWFSSKGSWRVWNSRYAGSRAGSVSIDRRTGYQFRRIVILGRIYKEHHIAWMLMTDEPLPEEIDHENRDGTDNRWANLRASTHAKNGRNQSMYRRNTSGVSGVNWHKGHDRWQARCMTDGKSHHLGYFDDLDEATQAVLAFRAEHDFDPGHGAELPHYHVTATP